MNSRHSFISGKGAILTCRQIKPSPLQLILFGFLSFTTIFFIYTGLAFAQSLPGSSEEEHALGNSSFAVGHNEATLQHEASAVEVPGELFVKFQKGVGRQRRQEALSRVASRVSHFEDRNIGKGNRRGPAIFGQLVHVKLKEGMTPEEAIADLERDPLVEYAEPNFVVSTLESFPDDPDFNLLWGLRNIGQTNGTAGADIDAPAAWDTSTGSAEVVVAVIDTGIEYTHPDLATNMWVNTGEIP